MLRPASLLSAIGFQRIFHGQAVKFRVTAIPSLFTTISILASQVPINIRLIASACAAFSSLSRATPAAHGWPSQPLPGKRNPAPASFSISFSDILPSPQVSQVVCDQAPLQPHLVEAESVAAQWRHLHGLLAFLDPLLGRASFVLEPHFRPARQAQVRNDKAHSRKRLALMVPDLGDDPSRLRVGPPH
jgi:hypothetical protein